MDQMHQVLIIESMRRSKAVPAFCLFEKCDGRPSLDEMKRRFYGQQVACSILGHHVFREQLSKWLVLTLVERLGYLANYLGNVCVRRFGQSFFGIEQLCRHFRNR